jgi:hypothetical protein
MGMEIDSELQTAGNARHLSIQDLYIECPIFSRHPMNYDDIMCNRV